MNATNKYLISNINKLLKKNVLIIDDEVKNLKSFKGLLRKEVNVFTASNKFEALDVVENNKIDYVFCDYRLPKFNGADILKEIVKICPKIKRSIVTAYVDSSIVKEFKEKSGTEDIIYKPYSFDEIIMRVLGLNRIHK
jgi:response regulator RpfG family c-di-GMP phosphodiesterase